MKERPILFRGPMVRAILDGRKTQTRRVIKPQPTLTNRLGMPFWDGKGPVDFRLCPHGQSGDRLWVRETFAIDHGEYLGAMSGLPPVDPHHIYYAADGEDLCSQVPECDCSGGVIPWRPSIFMPRWASRITLEIASVRVERLQEISEEDAIDEGVEQVRDPNRSLRRQACGPAYRDYGENGGFLFQARQSFMSLWDSINSKPNKCSGLDYGHPWTSNPWVWVIEFQKV